MKQKGFTLIELLIVIAIIGLLSSIVISALNSSRDKAQVSATKGAMSQILTQGQLYYSDKNYYAPATTSSRVGCFNTPTFLTDDTFFGDNIPSQMLLNLDSNGAPISCSISKNGDSFSVVAYIGNNQFLCKDTDSNVIMGNLIDNTSGKCIVPPLATPVAPVLVNNAGKHTPTALTVPVGTKITFQFTGNNQTKTHDCTNGGPTFTLGPGSTLFEYTFSSTGSYFCKRNQNGTPGVTITVTP